MLLQQKEGTISMPQTIEYEENILSLSMILKILYFIFLILTSVLRKRTWNLSIFIPTMKFISC